MTGLTPENVQELATIVRENSGGTITAESSPVHMSAGGNRLDIEGPGWYLSVVATHHEGGLEHARMALESLVGWLGELLASGEYEENILRSQGKTHEAGIAKLKRLYRDSITVARCGARGERPIMTGHAEGLKQALEAMGEHVE